MIMAHSTIETDLQCTHCGEPCPTDSIHENEHLFCCHGCQTVYHLLQENNLCDYYELNKLAGNSLKGKNFEGKFAYLDVPEIANPLYDFYKPTEARITLYLPTIHCSSCIWLLENFTKIRDGVLQSRVQFLKKELALVFNPEVVSLRQIVELLATLGYEPSITLSVENESSKSQKRSRSKALDGLLLRLAVVGFCLGNVMMMSFPAYFGIDAADHSLYGLLFRWLNLGLSVPVVLYGASPFWYSAWQSIKQKTLNIDVPISLGILTLFVRSLVETIVWGGEGYYDSLSGLIFMLLIGRYVQQITYEGLNFERDYQSYFPLAATVITNAGERIKPVNDLIVKDILRLRPQELIPADSLLLSETALIDYSFVTGEAAAQTHKRGDTIFAGGRILQQMTEAEVLKPCSHSYLTQLWNKNEFAKPKNTPTTRTAALFARYFTFATLGLAFSATGFWLYFDSSLAINAFTAVLVVACPCALTLSMPFTMGMAMAILGKNKFYVRNSDVIQHLAEIDTVVFDKTGTLTAPNNDSLPYEGSELSQKQWNVLAAMTAPSMHPLSKSLYQQIKKYDISVILLDRKEIIGQGIEAEFEGEHYYLGKQKEQETNSPADNAKGVYLYINGKMFRRFQIKQSLRTNVVNMLQNIDKEFNTVLLTGDNQDGLSDIAQVRPFIGTIRTSQKPEDKMAFISHEQQTQQHKVLMIGDGLNDAGALRQANVGIALTQDEAQFSPASDAIADANALHKLDKFVTFARGAVSIVKWSFILSLVYNFAGLSVAVSGQLSPVFAAVFMPLSSISVVAFGVGFTALYARKLNL